MARSIDMPINITGKQRVKAMVGLIKASPAKRKNILRKVGRSAKTINAKRRREQQKIDGKPMQSRKKGTKKMFAKLVRKLRYKATSEDARLFFLDNAGLVADAHHRGIGDNFNIKKEGDEEKEKKGGNPLSPESINKPATRAQAKKLVDSGEFRIGKRITKNGKRKNGGKGRIPPMRWIIQNLTVGQAGLIYRSIKKQQNIQAKEKWDVPRTPRPWLGMNKQDTEQAANIIVTELAKQAN